MKRGLKGQPADSSARPRQCYNRYPDEKGTESAQSCSTMQSVSGVTTVTPMKRGLKDNSCAGAMPCADGYNRYPDEKGTESCKRALRHVELDAGYNRYPDEKGTERSIMNTVCMAILALQLLSRLKGD